jgi:uncharacterized membrane protein YedE/YeeE
MIDWTAFTPYSALAGGALIGAAAALFVLLDGRVAGVSGIVGGLLRPQRGDVVWRIAFIVGLIAAPLLYRLFALKPVIVIATAWPWLIVAGLLVGVGTRYGSGCTSGHGICGIARLSPRSIVATPIFMAAGFITVFCLRHLVGAP